MFKKQLFKILFALTAYMFSFFPVNGQGKIKKVIVIESGQDVANTEKQDSDGYKIYRLDSSTFKHLLQTNKKLIIQFWQPWCHGETYWIDNIRKMYEIATASEIAFILISDNIDEQNYFKIANGRVGMLVAYFNKYNIDFKTYILQKNTTIPDFRKILSTEFNIKLKSKYLCFYINDRRLILQNYSYKFYKKITGKIEAGK